MGTYTNKGNDGFQRALNVDSPALVVELKYNKDADAAIDQIHRKNYPAKVAEYLDSNIGTSHLLVGINYNKSGQEGKRLSCKIEKLNF